ncbi:hypothetical protein MASR1M50_12370 [Burkholderiales bacterium]
MLTFISGLAMIYTKSETGLHAIKDRHAVDITRAQRSALILFDGKRSLREVLDATASLGVTACGITQAQRSALILLDGMRSLREVLDATASLHAIGLTRRAPRGAQRSAPPVRRQAQPARGAGRDGIAGCHRLRRGGAGGQRPAAAIGCRAGRRAVDGLARRPDDAAVPLSEEERVRRYRVAYPLATQLTAKLGLKGFTLNLAVESAQGFDGLVELLPRLRSALGDEGVRPLQAVLQGR